MMPMNPMQIIRMMQSGNHQQMIQSMFGDMINKNPMLTNMMNLAKNNDAEGVRNIANNLFSSQNRDFNREFSDFMSNFRR